MGTQQNAPSPAEGPQRHDKKLSSASWHTILGLILGLAGSLGVIQLRPQIVVMPQTPLVRGQPFSVPLPSGQ